MDNNSMNIQKPHQSELPTYRQLFVASIAAVLVLVPLLLVIILPAEYGIDTTGIGQRLHLTRMGKIKVAMAEDDAPIAGRPNQSDAIDLTLPAGQGMEIKLEMKKGFVAEYSWTTIGGSVTHDTHGDLYGHKEIYVTYSKASNVTSDSGTIEAIYGGYHGWYWKNNGTEPVTVSLQTNGQYLALIPM